MQKLTSIPQYRLGIYAIICLVILPLLFFVFFEIALELFDVGYNPKLLLQKQRQGNVFIYNNPEYTHTFFSENLAASFLPYSFTKKKSANTYRIFILGGSAAAGYPNSGYNFARIIELMLKEKFPKVHFEVINTANVAINSHVIFNMTKKLSQYDPNMFIIYLGNNEVVGPYGPGTVLKGFSTHISFIRLGIAARSTRIGQWIDSLTQKLFSTSDKPKTWKGMEMFVGKYVLPHDPRLTKTYDFFKTNLRDIVTIVHRTGAQTIISTVVSNSRSIAPFSSQPPDKNTEQYQKHYDQGTSFQASADYKMALEEFTAAAEIHNQHADLHFRLGQCYEMLEKPLKSRMHYHQALELDTLRFRADKKINKTIRNVAQQYQGKNVFLVDAEKIFSQQSPLGCPGKEFLYEHVHFNFHGNYLLAQSIFLEIQKHLPPWILKRQKKEDNILPEHTCVRLLAYTNYERLFEIDKLLNSLVNEFPFTEISNRHFLMQDLKDSFDQIDQRYIQDGFNHTVDQYLSALKLSPQDPWIHFRFGRFLRYEKPELALKHFRVAYEMLPSSKQIKLFIKKLKKDRNK